MHTFWNHGMNAKLHHFSIRLCVRNGSTKMWHCLSTFMALYSSRLCKNPWKVHGQISEGGDVDKTPTTGIPACPIRGKINKNCATLACNKDISVACRRNSISWLYLCSWGAFNSTTSAAIQEALESCDIGRTVIRWIVNNMLKFRDTYLTYQDKRVETSFPKGCPQREVLSPKLWCMVVDSPL